MDFRTQSRFDRALRRKQRRNPRAANAVLQAMQKVLHDPENRGLNQHILDPAQRIWDVYVTRSARITYQRDGDTIIFRNNCRHDIIDRRQW